MTLAALLLAASWPAAAQTATLEFKPPPAPVVIGTPVEIEGVAHFPAGLTLGFEPLETQTTGPVAVLGVQIDKDRVRLKVAAFELGMVSLPDMKWQLHAADGSSLDISVPALRFESVGPPGAKPGQEIRDIRGPLSPAWWPLALLLALLAGAAAWWWRRRESAMLGGAATAADDRLPHQRALDELRALYGAELPVKEFYIRLTDILRRYFQGRFGVDAAVLTTGDLMRHLRESELDRPLLSHCREVFDHADLVKFAKWVPSTAEIRKDWTEAEDLVQKTAPKPAPVPESASG